MFLAIRNKSLSNFEVITLPNFENEKGSLTVIQNLLPFLICRIYWIYNADGQTRGGHRHKETIQAAISMSGAVNILMNDGVYQENIILNSPTQCLIIQPKDWHSMTFEKNSVLLVVASHEYDKDDYIFAPYE